MTVPAGRHEGIGQGKRGDRQRVDVEPALAEFDGNALAELHQQLVVGMERAAGNAVNRDSLLEQRVLHHAEPRNPGFGFRGRRHVRCNRCGRRRSDAIESGQGLQQALFFDRTPLEPQLAHRLVAGRLPGVAVGLGGHADQ